MLCQELEGTDANLHEEIRHRSVPPAFILQIIFRNNIDEEMTNHRMQDQSKRVFLLNVESCLPVSNVTVFGIRTGPSLGLLAIKDNGS